MIGINQKNYMYIFIYKPFAMFSSGYPIRLKGFVCPKENIHDYIEEK